MDVDLHTDLLNKAERDKIAEAGDYLEAIYEGITDSGVGGKNNTIKEKIYGNILKKTAEKYPGLVKLDEKVLDENGEILADKLNEKGNRTKDLLDFFALNVGYEGEIPEILIGDLPPGQEAFAAPDHNKIVIDRKVLASADSDKVLSLLAHELGHFNSYDTNTESTAKRMENTVSGAVSQKEPTAEYEENFQKKYAGKDISGSEAQKIIDGIPEENKEKIAVSDSSNNIAGAPVIGRVNVGMTQYYVIDTKTGEGNEVNTFDIGIGFGTPSLGASTSMVILPHANSSKDIEGYSRVIGGAVNIFGGEILLDSNNNFMGIKYNIGISPEGMPSIEVHTSIDSSIIRNIEGIKINNQMIETAKEIEVLAATKESAITNAVKIDILSRKLLWNIRKEKVNGGNNENIKIKK